MPQSSKILQARKEWRKKAIQRGYRIREYKKSQKRHLCKIADLKRQNRQLIQANDAKKSFISVKKN